MEMLLVNHKYYFEHCHLKLNDKIIYNKKSKKYHDHVNHYTHAAKNISVVEQLKFFKNTSNKHQQDKSKTNYKIESQ